METTGIIGGHSSYIGILGFRVYGLGFRNKGSELRD